MACRFTTSPFTHSIYPQLDVVSPASAYDDYPSPDFPNNNVRTPATATRALPNSDARTSGGRYAASPPSARRPSETFSNGRQSADAYGGVEAYGGAGAGAGPVRRKPSDARRRPSQDTTYAVGASVNRRPSESEGSNASNAQSATAGMGMIIPNKSTIAEEEIEVPYGREVRDSGSTARDRERERAPRISRADEDRSDYGEDEPEEGSRPGGLAALSARLQAVGDEDEEAGRSGEDYFDKMSIGRTSAASERSFARGGRNSAGAEEELRREYEYKIATMQQRITGLEREVEESREKERAWAKGEERVRAIEDELRELRHVSVGRCVKGSATDYRVQRMEEKTTAMFTLQQELETLRQERAREQEAVARRSREDEEELQILRERCERLEEERVGGGGQVSWSFATFVHLLTALA